VSTCAGTSLRYATFPGATPATARPGKREPVTVQKMLAPTDSLVHPGPAYPHPVLGTLVDGRAIKQRQEAAVQCEAERPASNHEWRVHDKSFELAGGKPTIAEVCFVEWRLVACFCQSYVSTFPLCQIKFAQFFVVSLFFPHFVSLHATAHANRRNLRILKFALFSSDLNLSACIFYLTKLSGTHYQMLCDIQSKSLFSWIVFNWPFRFMGKNFLNTLVRFRRWFPLSSVFKDIFRNECKINFACKLCCSK